MRLRIALWVALVVGCASGASTWRPIPGATVMPWEQAQAVCAPYLEQGKAGAGGGRDAAALQAKAQYHSCMAQNGWTDSAISQHDHEKRMRDRHEHSEQLNAKLEESRTKNALTLLVGDPPECQPGNPGTEICSWRWIQHLPTESIPLQLICVLPKDGSPRAEDSCRVAVRSEKR